MTNKEKQQIDDWFDSYTPEQLKEKWEKYNYLSNPKKSNFFIYCYITLLKKSPLFLIKNKIRTDDKII